MHFDKLLIIGAGGHGKVVADIAQLMGKWRDIYFLDDNSDLKTVSGCEVIGQVKDLYKFVGTHDIFVAIGNNAVREELTRHAEEYGAHIPSIIHPTAIIAKDVIIGPGSTIVAGAIINTHTVIGRSCIVNTGATIGHDNVLRDFVHVSSGCNLAGTVEVGRRTWIGLGAVICNNISITENCLVAAGSVVINNLAVSGTYYGIPAKLRVVNA